MDPKSELARLGPGFDSWEYTKSPFTKRTKTTKRKNNLLIKNEIQKEIVLGNEILKNNALLKEGVFSNSASCFFWPEDQSF